MHDKCFKIMLKLKKKIKNIYLMYDGCFKIDFKFQKQN